MSHSHPPDPGCDPFVVGQVPGFRISSPVLFKASLKKKKPRQMCVKYLKIWSLILYFTQHYKRTHMGCSTARLEHSRGSSWSPARSLSCTHFDGSTCILWLCTSSRTATPHKAWSHWKAPYGLPGKSLSLFYSQHIHGIQMQTSCVLKKDASHSHYCCVRKEFSIVIFFMMTYSLVSMSSR